MILKTEQARAIYNAMCELNNIGARLNCQFDSALNYVNIAENETGLIRVVDRFGKLETHTDQNAFAAAYGVA